MKIAWSRLDPEGTQMMSHYTAINNDITELPTQCKNGLIFLVSNSDEKRLMISILSLKDNFVRWSWCMGRDSKPGLRNSFDETTMPYQIVRQGVFDSDGDLTSSLLLVLLTGRTTTCW